MRVRVKTIVWVAALAALACLGIDRVFSQAVINGARTLPEISSGSISNPPANSLTTFVCDDGGTTKLCSKDSAGTVAMGLGGGGSSALRIRDGLAVEYDPAPSSPNTEDDEFDAASLDAKWTVVTNTAASVDYDTTWQSHAFIEFDGDQDYEITQSYAPAGDFSITCSYTVAGTTNFQQAVLAAHDNNATPGAGDSVYIDYLYTTGHVIRLIRVDGGGASVIVTYSVPGVNHFYLHLQRVGSTWSAWFSFNALSWFRIATTSKSFTVDKIGLLMQQGGATTPALFGVDWVRRDWITF